MRAGAVGGEVGYRVRFEHRGGADTRLWFVTEGVFGRRLADDPFLEDVGVVVLDEFHERHLQGDLALAVVRELQDSVRPDLKLVVMSATLATESLAKHLPGATVLTSEGRAHPVAIAWAPLPPRRRLSDHVASLVRDALREPGDVLVFLPGAGEIRRTAEALGTAARRRRRLPPRRSAARRAAARAACRPAAARGARDQRRRDGAHRRGRDRGGRLRARARRPLRPAARARSSRDGADQPLVGRAARRPRRPPRTRTLHPGLERGRARRSSRARDAGDPPPGPHPHGARAARLGLSRRRRASVARSAAGDGARARGAAARAARRGRSARRRAHRRRPAGARAAGLAAPRAHAARGRGRRRRRGGGAARRARRRARHPARQPRVRRLTRRSPARRVGPAAARRPVRGGRAAWILHRCLPRARARSARRASGRARAAAARARRPRRGRRCRPAAALRARRVPRPRLPPPRAGLRPCGHGGRYRRRAGAGERRARGRAVRGGRRRGRRAAARRRGAGRERRAARVARGALPGCGHDRGDAGLRRCACGGRRAAARALRRSGPCRDDPHRRRPCDAPARCLRTR